MTGSVPRRHDVLIQHDVEARMRDGVVLRANVYRPAGDGRYPVLLSRQPYNKDVNINLMYADPVFLAARGYIVVMQDVRGRYASDGEFDPERPGVRGRLRHGSVGRRRYPARTVRSACSDARTTPRRSGVPR